LYHISNHSSSGVLGKRGTKGQGGSKLVRNKEVKVCPEGIQGGEGILGGGKGGGGAKKKTRLLERGGGSFLSDPHLWKVPASQPPEARGGERLSQGEMGGKKQGLFCYESRIQTRGSAKNRLDNRTTYAEKEPRRRFLCAWGLNRQKKPIWTNRHKRDGGKPVTNTVREGKFRRSLLNPQKLKKKTFSSCWGKTKATSHYQKKKKKNTCRERSKVPALKHGMSRITRGSVKNKRPRRNGFYC